MDRSASLRRRCAAGHRWNLKCTEGPIFFPHEDRVFRKWGHADDACTGWSRSSRAQALVLSGACSSCTDRATPKDWRYRPFKLSIRWPAQASCHYWFHRRFS